MPTQMVGRIWRLWWLALVVGCLPVIGGCTQNQPEGFKDPTWRITVPPGGRLVRQVGGKHAEFVLEAPTAQQMAAAGAIIPAEFTISFAVEADRPTLRGNMLITADHSRLFILSWHGDRLAAELSSLDGFTDSQYLTIHWDMNWGKDQRSLWARCRLKYAPPELKSPLQETFTFSVEVSPKSP
ncbi:MAG: hypothetical protein JXL80_10430 [Planctomycetes bacterium]|nr:hypothetical protein [Planctomycetota bacterium]